MSDAPSHLLTEVTLRSFKAAFKPQPIPLQAFNVIIGRNGSGKSTLLEALQWLDTTMRRDAREASDRYHGVQDLVNLRSQSEVLGFELILVWSTSEGQGYPFRYGVKVEEEGGIARIAREGLVSLRDSGRVAETFITTSETGERMVG